MRELLTAAGDVIAASGPRVPGIEREDTVLVSLEDWTNRQASGAAAQIHCGVLLPGATPPETLPPALFSVPLLAIEFPQFADGRGLSLAVLLRTRYGFRGELRACGDLLPDLLHYLVRCGFDSFLLPERFDPEAAAALLQVATEHYQGSVVEPLPLFRRRRDARWYGQVQSR
jgi:uncharacterized protein (DUF934 family)